MSDNDDQFGTPNYEAGSFTGGNRLKILGSKTFGAVTHNVFRIVPPILDQRATGKIMMEEPVHGGYYGVGKDPTKPAFRTFLCPLDKNFRTGEIYVPCAECAMIERLSAEREAICAVKNVKEAVLEASLAKLSEGDRARFRMLSAILDGAEEGRGAHKVDNKKNKINAISRADGQAGALKLSYTVWAQIKSKRGEETTRPGIIDQYRNVWDAVAADKGLWIDIIRTGNGSGRGTPLDKAVVVDEAMPGNPTARQLVPAPLTEDMKQAIRTGCRDLSDCSPSVRVSSEQVAELVDLFLNDQNTPEEVDRVLGTGQKKAPPVVAQVPAIFRSEPPVDVNSMPAFADATKPATEVVVAAPVAPIVTAPPVVAPPLVPVVPAAAGAPGTKNPSLQAFLSKHTQFQPKG